MAPPPTARVPEEALRRAVALALVCLAAAACATTRGYWQYTHATRGAEERASDGALGETSWLSSPAFAQFIRLEGEAEKEGTPLGTTLVDLKRRNARDRHVAACMAAGGYKLLWFDAESPRGRPVR